MTSTNSKNPIITLCGSRISNPGKKFVFRGRTSLCENCRLSGVCLKNLEEGRLYEIVERRDVKHACQLHDDGVVTVTVNEPQFYLAVLNRVAVEGASFTYHPENCEYRDCEQWGNLCDQEFIIDGDRLQIVSIEEKNVSCRKKKELSSCLCTRVS